MTAQPTLAQVSDSNEELLALYDVLPPGIRQAVEAEAEQQDLLEVVLDLGRPPEARFIARDVYLSNVDVSRSDIDHVISRVGAFGDDNRAGIERTLHRISAIKNRRGGVIGLTCRVGRAVQGSARVVEDFALSGKSILLVGRPGVGKTTILRELARVLATPTSASSSSTPPTRSPETATSRTRPSAKPGACRSRLRCASTPS